MLPRRLNYRQAAIKKIFILVTSYTRESPWIWTDISKTFSEAQEENFSVSEQKVRKENHRLLTLPNFSFLFFFYFKAN